MGGRKDDRRVQFTKRVLRESLIDLLYAKPIRKITIKELCDAADINRGTFYAHFQDQYALLQYTESCMAEEICVYVRAMAAARDLAELREQAVGLFANIQSNARVWRALLSENGSGELYRTLFEVSFADYVAGRRAVGDEAALRLQYTFILIGGIGMTLRWLNEEAEQTPARMADILLRAIGRLPAAP